MTSDSLADVVDVVAVFLWRIVVVVDVVVVVVVIFVASVIG